ncbi:protein tyrosine/serine phosphatase [Trichlorobacter thiogenes]|uniref:Protein tyrosine/serine phosphatase n=1 Tax=Trichlorobacter thiogenes TaxID=115783 RepID=A0A1T4KAM5_9BACT|nr:tyrosine-protein phosphatase [Trichlorobacter thiogenes]SJZ39459.1 protein tyrosine/serine phosphatase [Trichlorobacter thiogenes]
MLLPTYRFLIIVACCLTILAGIAWANAPAVATKPAANQTVVIRSSEHLYNLPGLGNAGRVAPGVYRGEQPGPGGYTTLKQLGVKTVIDLRTSESEKAQVEAAGMRAIAVPIEMTRKGLKEKVDQVVALMADPANQPVYVHCRHGQDRTGIVVAAYRMTLDNWSLKDVEAEMQSFGFNDVWVNFKKFIRSYKVPAGKALQPVAN